MPWRVCDEHWDRLRTDLRDRGMVLASTLAMHHLAVETGGSYAEPGEETVCPLCSRPDPATACVRIVDEVRRFRGAL